MPIPQKKYLILSVPSSRASHGFIQIFETMIYLYRIYQVLIMMPLMLVITLLTSLIVAIGSILFGGRVWGYYPAVVWARAMAWLTFVRVTVHGRENISKGRSYVFVANHQGAYDIFAIYGWLGHNFKWMMKASLRKIPFVGFACERAGHIYVDRKSPSGIRRSMAQAERQLSGGMSVVVFPEGSRSRTGRIGTFKRGAFMLATEFGLPVVPVTIDGAYNVMPRDKKLPLPGHITLTIHKPIEAVDGKHDLGELIDKSREAIESSL